MKHTQLTKRTNLVLDPKSLDELVALLGQKTYSHAVQMAIDETIRKIKARSVLKYMGKRIWQGTLSEMRDDH